jgi:hypothetical protein
MKSPIIALALAAAALFASSPQAEARHHRGRGHSSHVYISGYRSCGTPIYTEKYLRGYDCHGYPIWGYRQVAPPRQYCPPPRPRYYSEPVYPQRPCYDGYRNGGVVIQGVFRL